MDVKIEHIKDPIIRKRALALAVHHYENDTTVVVSEKLRIQIAFVWDKTDEGHDYWANIENACTLLGNRQL